MPRIQKKLPYTIAFAFGLKQLREPDNIRLQLLSGRCMLENGQITHKDVFSNGRTTMDKREMAI
jgi:hypothetical protein